MNITGALDFLEYKNFYNLYDNNKCTVFALWMYDYLIKIFKDHDNYSKTKAVIDKIYPLFLRYSEKLHCKIPSYNDIVTYVNNLKTLYDYATNYDTILGHIKDKDYKCNENLSNYIQEQVNLLKEVRLDCHNTSQNHCEVYKNIFGPSIGEKFLSLQCNPLSSQEISTITVSSHVQQGKEQITNDETTKTSNIIMETIFP
ncbi:hypothetical protein PCYB_005260, partial [Plasmodium cynomolgi strain B]